MISIFLSFCLSLTWKDLESGTQVTYETVRKTIAPQISVPSSDVPKLYQSSSIKNKIADSVPFVGVIDCTFEKIENIRGGIIELKNAALKIVKTKFKEIKNTYAVALEYCHDVTIEESEFSDIDDGGGVSLKYCNNIKIVSSKFEDIEANDITFCALMVDTCTFVSVKDSTFSENEMNASVVTVSNTNRFIMDGVIMKENSVISPGCLFCCSSENVFVVNSQFKKNIGGTHSVALLSLQSIITLKNNIFESNLIDLRPEGDVSSVVNSLPFWLASMTVTIISPTIISSTDYPSVIGKLYFKDNGQLPDGYHFLFTLISIDIHSDSSRTNVDDVVETTGSSSSQFNLGSRYDTELVKKGVSKLGWSELVKENISTDVDYGIQPLLPEIRHKRIQTYHNAPVVIGNGPYGFIAIDGCQFEDSTIISMNNNDETSYIHIDFHGAGYVSIANSILEDNIVSSSVLEVINAKGVSISECTFTYNLAKHSAGALLVNIDTVRICGCSFQKNSAYVHGVVSLYNCSDCLIIQSVFRKNTGFFGCSSLIASHCNLLVNDTVFNKNNLDFKESGVPKDYEKISQSDLVLPHSSIVGVDTPQIFAISMSLYNSTRATLSNVAFIDSENECENFTTEYFNLSALEGYAEDGVVVVSEHCFTDTRNLAFSDNWGVRFDDDQEDINPYYRYIQTYAPIGEDIPEYNIVLENNNYNINISTTKGIVYHPINRALCNLTLEDFRPTDTPTHDQKDIVYDDSASKSVRFIIISTISFTIIVLLVTAIYFCRRPPEDRLEDDEEDPETQQRKEGLLGDDKNEDAEL